MRFFAGPSMIYFGQDALQSLCSFTAKKAFIITDKNIVKLGLTDLVIKELDAMGTAYSIFDEVEPDPSLETVRKASKVIGEVQPDLVIGLGGGSVLDACKVVFVSYCGGVDPGDIMFTDEYDSTKAKLIGIPTTAGTGAEVSYGAMLTDTEYQRKIAVGHFMMVPAAVILDPVMTVGLPPPLTAETGMDALAHAIEGYVTTLRTQFTDAPGLIAIRSILKFLPRAYKDGSDLEAREGMLNAASQACLCCVNGMAGLAHHFAHGVGALHHLSHGKGVGLLLPYTMEYQARGSDKTTMARYAEIARICGIATGPDEKCSDALIAKVRELLKSMKLPMSIKETGIDRTKYMESMSGMVERASDEQSGAFTRVPDNAEMEKILNYVYDGKHIDF
ncbi:MAG: iron-containing alcohol dehydrogenase [Chloroflexi bacterium]|nr:iron-containing alcohol dehydrogenase [Chloroflexota bacterium]